MLCAVEQLFETSEELVQKKVVSMWSAHYNPSSYISGGYFPIIIITLMAKYMPHPLWPVWSLCWLFCHGSYLQTDPGDPDYSTQSGLPIPGNIWDLDNSSPGLGQIPPNSFVLSLFTPCPPPDTGVLLTPWPIAGTEPEPRAELSYP